MGSARSHDFKYWLVRLPRNVFGFTAIAMLSDATDERRAEIAALRERLKVAAEGRATLKKEIKELRAARIVEKQAIRDTAILTATINGKIKEVSAFTAQIHKINFSLRCLFPCNTPYPSELTEGSDHSLSGNPLHLRMPFARSKCYGHGAGLDEPDDV
jgi:hypothetical protein